MGNHTATRARGRSNGGTKASAISLDQRAAVALARASAERTRELNPPQAAAARWVARWLSAHPITDPIPPSTPGLAKESARSRESRLYQNWQRPAEWIEATRGIRAVDPNAYHHATAAATEQGMVAQREWLANSTASGRGGRSSATIRSKTEGGAAKASGSRTRSPAPARGPSATEMKQYAVPGRGQRTMSEPRMHLAAIQARAGISVLDDYLAHFDRASRQARTDEQRATLTSVREEMTRARAAYEAQTRALEARAGRVLPSLDYAERNALLAANPPTLADERANRDRALMLAGWEQRLRAAFPMTQFSAIGSAHWRVSADEINRRIKALTAAQRKGRAKKSA